MAPTSRRIATRTLLAAASFALAGPTLGQTLEFVANQDAPTGIAEIVTYDKFTNQLFTTSGTGIDVYDFGTGNDFAPTSTIDLSSLFGGTLGSVSSVAVDPLGRGFGAALAIPSGNTTELGSVVLFDTTTGGVLKTLSTGYNPDMVTFTADGGSILIANEGEASTSSGSPFDPEGSLSILNVGGKAYGDLGGLTSADLDTFNFAPSNLADPSDLNGLRVDPRNEFNIPADLEPEYISVSNGKAYVALQENNAVGVFDLASQQWTDIFNLGGVVQNIDASNEDGGINIDDNVFGLHMPDAIATYVVGGTTYFVTANEGDARDGVDGEEQRVRDLFREGDASASAGDVFIDAAVYDDLVVQYGGDFQADDLLGRLRVTTIDGDTDGDGDIDVLTMYGTRSFSIFNGDTGARVFDSGNDFESITAPLGLPLFNDDDGRSDDKGPEPEGIAITEVGGKTLAAIGLERTGGIMIYDISDPNSPIFLQYLNSDLSDATSAVSPEGLAWITGGDSPTGETFLVVSYEVSGSVDVFKVVPEPGSFALLSLGGLLLARRRRQG